MPEHPPADGRPRRTRGRPRRILFIRPVLRLLGHAVLEAEDGTPLLGPGRALGLLAYLACQPRRSAPRALVTRLLWEPLDPDAAQHALSQTIWRLRQLLGRHALEGRREVQLTLPIDSDRDRFLAAIAEGAYGRAVQAYAGPFLPVEIKGSPAFGQWVEEERVRLRGIFVRVGTQHVRTLIHQTRFDDAEPLARRIDLESA